MEGRKKVDLKDVTFVIPIKIDSTERKENLHLICDYLLWHFDTNILIGEHCARPLLDPVLFEGSGIKCIFIQSASELFHKTRVLNILVKAAETPYVCIYDADVLMRREQYMDAVDDLRKNKADVIYPFNGSFLDIDRLYVEQIRNSNMSLYMLSDKNFCILSNNSPGGAFFIKKESWDSVGGGNENFRSWGWEDNEFFYRFQRLGLRLKRSPGVIYHVSHPRGINSSPGTPHSIKNKEEYDKVLAMTEEDLRSYIQSWKGETK